MSAPRTKRIRARRPGEPLSPLAPLFPNGLPRADNGANGDDLSAGDGDANALPRSPGAVVRSLDAARCAGIQFDASGDGIRPQSEREPSPALLPELRRHKAELVEILRGNRCQRCGKALAWPLPSGVAYGDGAAEHHACRLYAAGERPVHSPDVLADGAELTARGELPP